MTLCLAVISLILRQVAFVFRIKQTPAFLSLGQVDQPVPSSIRDPLKVRKLPVTVFIGIVEFFSVICSQQRFTVINKHGLHSPAFFLLIIVEIENAPKFKLQVVITNTVTVATDTWAIIRTS
jgi:hypothetical protein